MVICEFCKKNFKSEKILKIHKNNTKYCLKIQNKQKIYYQCEFCNKKLMSIQNLKHHHNKCIVKIKKDTNDMYNGNMVKLEEIHNIKINNLTNTIEILQKQVQTLQDKLENIAIKAATKPTTIVQNTQNIEKLINNFAPITDEHLREQAKHLSIEHIRDGAPGYARFALDYPLKNRIACVDYARKKIKYKNQDGHIVVDPEMSKLSQKLFKAIDLRNEELINEYTQEIQQKIFGKHNSEMSEEETKIGQYQSNALIELCGEMISNKIQVNKIGKGMKTEMFSEMIKQICSNVCLI